MSNRPAFAGRAARATDVVKVEAVDGLGADVLAQSLADLALATIRAAVNVFTKNQSVPFVALTDAATIAVDASLSNNFAVTLAGDRTLANPSNLTDGMVLNFVIRQDGTGTRLLAYGTKYKFFGSGTVSTPASSVDMLRAVYNAADDALYCTLQLAAA